MQTVNFHTEEFHGNELVIREGKALELKPPVQILLSGDIRSVAEFINKRRNSGEEAVYQYIDPTQAIVEVDREKFTITLFVDPSDVYGTEVVAKLEMEPELLKFGIETGRKFSQQELIKLLRYGKRWFVDPWAHEALLLAYMKLDVKVTADLTNTAPDGRGNRSNTFEKKVTSNIPEDFILNIPIFKGQDYKKFRVEIALDSTDGSTKFWLESVELTEMIAIESEAIFEKQLKSCADYVVIWK
jgi:hypothetical protein